MDWLFFYLFRVLPNCLSSKLLHTFLSYYSINTKQKVYIKNGKLYLTFNSANMACSKMYEFREMIAYLRYFSDSVGEELDRKQKMISDAHSGYKFFVSYLP